MSYEKKLGTKSLNHALLLKLKEREVERAQLKDWLDNEKTTEDVFKLLRLNTDKGGEILKKPVLTTWFKYVGMS
ncbi:hypothetical protein PC129_g17073, partial [Phytophthora cactorum]